MPWFPASPIWVSSFIRWDWLCSIPIRKTPADLEGRRLCAIAGRHFPGSLGLPAKCPFLPVGWLWHLGMLVPVIGLVQVGPQAMADRYSYLPQIGLYIVLAWGASVFPGIGPIVAASVLQPRRLSSPLWLGVLGSRCRIGKTTSLYGYTPWPALRETVWHTIMSPSSWPDAGRSMRPLSITARPWKSSPISTWPTTGSVRLWLFAAG